MLVVEERVSPTQRVANPSRVRKPTDFKSVEDNAVLNAVKAAYAANGLPSVSMVPEKKCPKQRGQSQYVAWNQ